KARRLRPIGCWTPSNWISETARPFHGATFARMGTRPPSGYSIGAGFFQPTVYGYSALSGEKGRSGGVDESFPLLRHVLVRADARVGVPHRTRRRRGDVP